MVNRQVSTFLFFFGILLSGTTLVAQQVRVPGTKVSMAPPAGFAASAQYPGFERQSEGATIMVTELPVPSVDMIRTMTAQNLATKGMQVLSSEAITLNGKPARVLHVRQRAKAEEVLKWLLVAGDERITVMVVGTFPTGSAKTTGDAIRTAILSTTWNAASPDPFEGLPFRINASRRLKLAQRVSNMLMFTETGTTGTPGTSEALFIAGHSIGRGQIDDLKSFSETRARQTTILKGLKNVTGKPVQIDGLAAYELEADGVDARTGVALRLYQVIVPDDTGYVILQGLSRAEVATEMFAEFRALTASFRQTDAK